MKHDPSLDDPPSRGRYYAGGPRLRRPLKLSIAFWAMLAIGAFYLLTEHRAHLALGLPYLPLLLLAACPLLHAFGHGGHGHRREHARRPPGGNVSSSGGAAANATESKVDSPHRHEGDLP